jgi:hypothetical protein
MPDADGEFVAVWPVGGGWNAALSAWGGEDLYGRRLWHSSDGVAWKAAARKPPAGWAGYDRVPVGVANASGRSMLAASVGGTRTTLATSADGKAWKILDGFPDRRAEVAAGVAGAPGKAGWVFAGRSGATGNCDGGEDARCWGAPTVWTSAKGVDWTTVLLPIGAGVKASEPGDAPVRVTAVTSLVSTQRGYVAVGAEGTTYDGARHETWVSDDAVFWTKVPQAPTPRFDYGPGLVADGPSGVIGISSSKGDGDLVVWRLQ